MLSSEVSLLAPREIFSTARKAIEEEKPLLLECRAMDPTLFGLAMHGDLEWSFDPWRAKGMRQSFEAMIAKQHAAEKVVCFYPRPDIAYHTQ